MADYGVNVDGEGQFVGLWFEPSTIEHDEKDYWHVNLDDLANLLRQANVILLPVGQCPGSYPADNPGECQLCGRFDSDHEYERCDYCGLKLEACPYMGLVHR